MKKTKTEAERDLLAKNHKRLNKEIQGLLDENKELRRRLHTALERGINAESELLNRNADDRRHFATAALHTLMLNAEAYKAPDQIAEQAWALADAMMRAK
jgi:hypothetical protein